MARARASLADAEHALRDAMSDALTHNDYAAVASIARLAESVAGLISTLPPPEESTSEAPAAAIKAAPDTKSATRPARHQPPKSAYPRYLRDGDRLVKVGWSKKNKAEYEHRAPRSVVQAVAATLTQKVKPGKLFEATEVLPVHMGQDEIPSYQSYLVLGWLQDAGLVERKGRDGYVLRQVDAASNLDAPWESLPVKPL